MAKYLVRLPTPGSLILPLISTGKAPSWAQCPVLLVDSFPNRNCEGPAIKVHLTLKRSRVSVEAGPAQYSNSQKGNMLALIAASGCPEMAVDDAAQSKVHI